MALIAQTHRPLMAQRTTCQINTMRLILISPIHNQCWKHSCPSCRSRQMMNTVHYLYISLLEMLKTHFPDRVGGAQGWNFEKAHSILHKVREIVMWGDSGRVGKHILPRSRACSHRYRQECGASHKQQGRVPLHTALSLPLWTVAAVRTVAGGHDWPG